LNKRIKGFTLVEVILALSLTTVILGIIGTFFFINNKSLINTEIKSDLQKEGENIQNELINIGQQARRINSITFAGDITPTDAATGVYSDFLDISLTIKPTNTIIINQAIDNNAANDIHYTLALNGRQLTISHQEGVNIISKVLSENVQSFEVIPLDFNSVSDADKGIKRINSSEGIQVSITLNRERGYSNVTLPIKTIIQFRNFNL